MTTTSIFGGEVARLEDELVAAKRALANAERQSNERAEQLRDVRRDLQAAEATVESLMKDLEDTRRDLDSARALAGRVSAAETKASDAEKALAGVSDRLDKTLRVLSEQQERGDAAQAALAEANGEVKCLAAEVDPARALAEAIRDREDADARAKQAATKIRAET